MNDLLRQILVANRAEPMAWIHSFLIPHIEKMGWGAVVDTEGNVYVPPLTDTKLLFVAHTDTVDNMANGDRELEVGNTLVELKPGQANRSLGSDDGAGVYALLRFMEAGVDAGYLFTTGEETGGTGIRFFIEHNREVLERYSMCIELDRKGFNEIITTQCVGVCASDEFAAELSSRLNGVYNFDFFPSDDGIYTDNADLSEYIPECVNLAIGYEGNHTNKEVLDYSFVEDLVDAFLVLEEAELLSTLPIHRMAGDYGDDFLTDVYSTTYTTPIHSVRDFIDEYPAVVTEFLLSVGVDVAELDEFAKKAGYTMPGTMDSVEGQCGRYDADYPY